MVCWGCTRVTGPLLEDLTFRNTPPNGAERTGVLWTGMCMYSVSLYCILLHVYRVVTNGIELFRTRYPGLAHYFHTRTGMWDQTKH